MLYALLSVIEWAWLRFALYTSTMVNAWKREKHFPNGFSIFLSSSLAHFSCFTTCLYRITFRISALALSLFTFLCYNKKNTGVTIISTTVTNDRRGGTRRKHHRSLFPGAERALCLVLCTQLDSLRPKRIHSPASGKRYDDSLITEAISKEGSFHRRIRSDWDYSYHIPQLADDTTDAESINKAIMNILSSDAQATLSSSSVTKMPETHYVGYFRGRATGTAPF